MNYFQFNLEMSFIMYSFVTSNQKTKNKMETQNWSVEKKDEIETRFINIITKIGMDIPNNFEEIVQDIYEDVCQTADTDNWNDDDIVIGFRRWIESK